MDQVRLGIIGTGLAVEKLHWPALRQMPDRFRVVAFANRGRDNAERFAAYSGTPLAAWTPDYRALLARDDVEAVLISLPIPLNEPVTRDALAAGKHVVCEKPAGKNGAEGRAFVDLASTHPDRVVMVAENWFYRDDLRLARALLDKGRIGRLHFVAWRTVSQLVPTPGDFSITPWRHEADYEGGPHLDAGVHYAAELRLLCGDIERLSGEIQDANSIFGGPSDLVLNLRFVSGAAGSYAASWPEMAVPAEPNDLRLYGTDGVMVLGRNDIRIHRPDGAAESFRVEESDGGYYNEFLDFHRAVTEGTPLLVGTAAQSYRNMEIILGGLESARTGQPVRPDAWPDPLSATPVPLWRPSASDDLFAGLPTRVVREEIAAG